MLLQNVFKILILGSNLCCVTLVYLMFTRQDSKWYRMFHNLTFKINVTLLDSDSMLVNFHICKNRIGT